MTDHLEETFGKDPDAYAKAVQVIENSALASQVHETNKRLRHPSWIKSAIPPYEGEKGETPSDDPEIDRWCGHVLCGVGGFFLGLLMAGILIAVFGVCA